MVEVYYVRADGPSGLVEELLKIVRALHLPPRHLGGYIYPVAPAAGEGLANSQLALAAEIDTPRVDVVHSTLNGTAHHRGGLVEVYMPVLHRQAQHTEAQCRHVYPRASHGAVSHLRIIVEDVFCLLFLHRSILGFLRNGFRPFYGSYGCGKKPTFVKSRLSIF